MGHFTAKDFEKDEYADYLKSWTFPTIFDEVQNEIRLQKEFLEERGIDRTVSKNFENYIVKIKKRCNKIFTNPKKKSK